MNEEQYLIDLIFKPDEPGQKLRSAETQLLLANIGEILQEIVGEDGSGAGARNHYLRS